MMVNYTDQSVLLQALDRQDFYTIQRCLNAGQDLNAIKFRSERLPLLLDAISVDKVNRFWSLMVFRKFLDLDIFSKSIQRVNALQCGLSHKFPFIHILLQNGAEPVMRTHLHYMEESAVLDECVPQFCMLLSCGMDPGDVIPCQRIRKQVQQWLASLECAKQHFRRIFDDENLEKELCNFVQNEVNLRKIA